MKIRREEHMAGGNGHVIIKEILDAEQLNGKCGLYAQVTLEPGCSLGYHEHHGESETYYILQGQGEYNDNIYKSHIHNDNILPYTNHICSHTNAPFPVRLQCVLQILPNLDICFCGWLGWLA